MTFPAPTQVWHASAECNGRTLPQLKDWDEFLKGSPYNVANSFDGPGAPVCPACGPRPPPALTQPSHSAVAPPRHPIPAEATPSALPFAPLPLAAATAAAPVPAPAVILPPVIPAANLPVPAPVNAAAAPPNPGCGCTAPKLAAVIDSNELLANDVLRYTNGSQVFYVRKRANEEYVFSYMNGVTLAGTHQGPKSLAQELIGAYGIVGGRVWSDFDVFRGVVRLGTLFELRHAAYVAGRLVR